MRLLNKNYKLSLLKIKPLLMNKALLSFIAVFLISNSFAQQNNVRLGSAQIIAKSDITNLPNFIKLQPGQTVKQENFVSWAVYGLNIPNNSTFKAYSVEKDGLGMLHTRHKQYLNDIPVEGSMLISHSKNGEVQLVNGDYYQNFSSNVTASITEQSALQAALKKVNANKYMWQNTLFQKQTGNDYTPHGELVIGQKKEAEYSAGNVRLAYKVNIYAETPLYRANVCVDANTAEILDEQNLICTIDVPGTALTKFSGTVALTSDSTAPASYRLRETGRGNGIETYNLQNGTTYVNNDFTNTSSAWTNTGADQVATDAHWGTEMTYDYYQTVHSRNSIDGNGFELKSYVHYRTNFINAFWNGQEMTYGDGDVGSGFYPLTSLDVCGHEVTHGLTNFTAGLGGGEAGALNEGFSDIFGTTIEFFARPLQTDWLMGADFMTNGAGFRDLSQPKNLGQPNTYQGTFWDPNGEVHQNDGPCIYWYYLLCQGGTGTNDLGNSWNVSGITMAKAQMIAFRGLTVYFTPSTNYAAARMYTIQAATDLYGTCSAEYQATMNAWHAVGVGAQYSATSVTPSFTNSGITCAVPMTVTFNNTSGNAVSYTWNFGDGGTSTAISPTHTFTSAATDTVKLVATSCAGNKDSTIKILTIGAIGSTNLLTEGFETTTLPGPDWNISSAGTNWMITSQAAATGAKSAMIDNKINTSGNNSILETISYDISAVVTPKFTFKMAYRQDTVGNNDKLQIFTSTDCGNTWAPRWARLGAALATVTPPDTTYFIPGTGNFTTYSVNINGVAGQSNVKFRFQFFADTAAKGPGNNIYLDDINLFDASIGIAQQQNDLGFDIYPNPSAGSTTVHFNFTETHSVSLSVSDVLGRVVESVPNRQYEAGETKLAIGEKVQYKAGVYFVNIIIDGKALSRKITVQ